jgi:hypothetical protein
MNAAAVGAAPRRVGGTYAALDRYYTGTQPLACLAPESKAALGNWYGPMASNISG